MSPSAGGYFFAGVARLVFVHHSTFCVNSLAHWAGSATYTDGHTARNSFITALCTVGGCQGKKNRVTQSLIDFAHLQGGF